ncbi:MAG: site-specific integrase [Chitinophagaceae bacterium]
MNVTLRTKPISGNRKSLYLDFYPPIPHPETGKLTRREFLGLYLLEKPKNPSDKDYNKETLSLAEIIKAKRQIEIQNNRFGFLSVKKYNADFIDYFKSECDKRYGKNRENWLCAVAYLERFTNGHLKFKDVTVQLCNEYREFLLKAKAKSGKQLAQNTAELYFTKFKATVAKAFIAGNIEVNISANVDNIRKAETERNFVTLEELNLLVRTECRMPVLKTAALFSALTGLRYSDIEKMVWSELQYIKGQGYFIHFKQKKTKGIEILPIPEQAYTLLGESQGPTDKVFEGLKYSAYANMILKDWILRAGITKYITFHCFRHTYATLQLRGGTDIYTVSKMLGHRELKTTQVYAKIIDKTKRDATEKIILDL